MFNKLQRKISILKWTFVKFLRFWVGVYKKYFYNQIALGQFLAQRGGEYWVYFMSEPESAYQGRMFQPDSARPPALVDVIESWTFFTYLAGDIFRLRLSLPEKIFVGDKVNYI